MYRKIQRGQGLDQGILEYQQNLDCTNIEETSPVREKTSKMVSLLKSRPHKETVRWFLDD